MVAIAVGAIVKEGRDGKIYFYQATEELISNQIIAEDTVYTGWPHAGMLMAGQAPLPQTIIALPYVLKADRNTRLGDIDSKDIGSYTKVSVNYFNYGSADPAAELQELFSGEVITDEDGNAKITYSDVPVYDLACDLPEGCTIKHYADVSLFHGDPETIYELVDRKSTRLNSSHPLSSRMPSSA